MNKIIMIMHMFKCFFYCLTVYTSIKNPKITQMPHIFPNSSQGPFPKIAGKGTGFSLSLYQNIPISFFLLEKSMQYCTKKHSTSVCELMTCKCCVLDPDTLSTFWFLPKKISMHNSPNSQEISLYRQIDYIHEGKLLCF